MSQSRQDQWGEASRGLAAFLDQAVEESGKSRRTIATETNINKDALRRILAGTRPATLPEALAILDVSGHAPRSAMLIAMAACSDRAEEWQHTGLLEFLEAFIGELPNALEQALGERLREIRPRWAAGTAQRTARLLSDHLSRLEQQEQHAFALPS